MAYATAEDVETVLGRALTDEEIVLVDRRLEQVERMILRRIPDLAEQIAAEDIAEDDVIDVEAESVLRVIRNPDGVYMEGRRLLHLHEVRRSS